MLLAVVLFLISSLQHSQQYLDVGLHGNQQIVQCFISY